MIEEFKVQFQGFLVGEKKKNRRKSCFPAVRASAREAKIAQDLQRESRLGPARGSSGVGIGLGYQFHPHPQLLPQVRQP